MAHGDKHITEQTAEHIANYIDTAARYLVDAMSPDGRPPFAANVSKHEQAAYFQDEYYNKFFNPDGSKNEPEHDAFIEKFGVDGYAAVMRLFNKRRPIGSL